MSEPYKITIQQYDTKVSIEKDHSDISLEDFAEMLYNISKAAGWSEEQLKDIFIDENQEQ
jgi:hypothetical protein|tara:strand:- start:1612 stop:1791 length:180 start_codon:yes stop_codon:yes gene_type:complete